MITVTGLTKQYGKSVAVDDMTFDVAAGRVTGFVGPNGAGKSTTMRMMVGLTRPQAGDVRYSGVHYRDLKHPARTVGPVLDARCMHPGRTARNHLRATAALSGIPSARVAEVLGEVGLEPAADKRAGTFSLGMRQRLALASALLGDPQVLLLDEPSNGLDPDGIRWLRNYLNDFARRGGTVFVSSHLISELGMFADDLVVVGGGRLLAAESVGAITARNDVAVRVEDFPGRGPAAGGPRGDRLLGPRRRPSRADRVPRVRDGDLARGDTAVPAPGAERGRADRRAAARTHHRRGARPHHGFSGQRLLLAAAQHPRTPDGRPRRPPRRGPRRWSDLIGVGECRGGSRPCPLASSAARLPRWRTTCS
jgi:ABC-2 type transport system ATP-binding protein